MCKVIVQLGTPPPSASYAEPPYPVALSRLFKWHRAITESSPAPAAQKVQSVFCFSFPHRLAFLVREPRYFGTLCSAQVLGPFRICLESCPLSPRTLNLSISTAKSSVLRIRQLIEESCDRFGFATIRHLNGQGNVAHFRRDRAQGGAGASRTSRRISVLKWLLAKCGGDGDPRCTHER
jgi:hypothetical protein